MAAYRDKMEDPSQAEPVVERMIQMEPNEPTNYFALAKIYEDAGEYDEAEATLSKARKPSERPDRLHAARRLLQPPGRVRQDDRALKQRAAKEPNNPEAYHTLATYYWDKAFRDNPPQGPEKREVHPEGHRGRRQGDQVKPRLHGSARLQGPAAAPAGEHGEGSGQQKAL